MTRNLETQIDDLYRLPLEDFTRARNTLAKTLSGGDRKQVGLLAKPSVPAWVINQLYWHDASTYKALIDAAEKLRGAHRAILTGRNADTRSSDRLHRATVDKAFSKAIGIAERRGLRLTADTQSTLRRALAALPAGEPPGRLARPPEPAGFSLLAGVKLPRQGPERRERSDGGVSREVLEAQRRAEREREKAESKTRKAKEKREREIRRAEQAIEEAQRRLAQLKR